MKLLKRIGTAILQFVIHIPDYYFTLMRWIIYGITHIPQGTVALFRGLRWLFDTKALKWLKIGFFKAMIPFVFLAKMIWKGLVAIWQVLVVIGTKIGQVATKIGTSLANMGRAISKFFDKKGLRWIKIGFTYLIFPIVWLVKAFNKYVLHFKQYSSMAQKRAFTGYMFLLPWTLGFLGLVIYPFARIVFMSFNNVFSYGQDYEYTFVGWENYRRILMDDIDFVLEVQNFVVRVLLYTPVIITLAIIIALLLNQNVKGKGLFRMIFFLPIIILNGALLENMSNYGGTDIRMSFFIIDVITTVVPYFAVNIFIEMFGYIVEILWYTGVPILIFLAMLQKIDRSLYEAASIDGANAWSMFWKVTLPIIRPAITVSIIFIVVFLANFDGNPINGIIEGARSQGDRREGYASALSILYSLVQIIVISILYFLARQRPQKGRA